MDWNFSLREFLDAPSNFRRKAIHNCKSKAILPELGSHHENEKLTAFFWDVHKLRNMQNTGW